MSLARASLWLMTAHKLSTCGDTSSFWETMEAKVRYPNCKRLNEVECYNVEASCLSLSAKKTHWFISYSLIEMNLLCSTRDRRCEQQQSDANLSHHHCHINSHHYHIRSLQPGEQNDRATLKGSHTSSIVMLANTELCFNCAVWKLKPSSYEIVARSRNNRYPMFSYKALSIWTFSMHGVNLPFLTLHVSWSCNMRFNLQGCNGSATRQHLFLRSWSSPPFWCDTH